MTTLYITINSETNDAVKDMFTLMGATLGVDVAPALAVFGLPADVASSLTHMLEKNGRVVHLVEDQPKPEPKPEVKAKPRIIVNEAAVERAAPKAKRPYTRKPKPEPTPEAKTEEQPAPAPFVLSPEPGTEVTVRISEAEPLTA